MKNSSPNTEGLSFLVGKTVEQVCIGRYQTLLNLYDTGTIEIACGLEVVVDGKASNFGDSYRIEIGLELTRFLGKNVSGVQKLDKVISLQFDDESCARLLLRGGGYESVNISGGPLGNLTFY